RTPHSNPTPGRRGARHRRRSSRSLRMCGVSFHVFSYIACIGPVLPQCLAKHESLYLAGWGLWELMSVMDTPRIGMRGVSAFHPFLYLAGEMFPRLVAILQDDKGLEHLSPDLIRGRYHSAFTYGWMAQKDRLDLSRADPVSRHDDDIV